MRMNIECAGWKDNSCDDGPGIRGVLFLQGCRKNCPGCQNKEQQVHGEGVWCEVGALAEAIIEKCKNKKITISGGEPLEQMEAVCMLGDILKRNDFNICIYTGWEWSQIPKEIFQIADIIKAGPYVENLKSRNLKFVGSSNQIMRRKLNGEWEDISVLN